MRGTGAIEPLTMRGTGAIEPLTMRGTDFVSAMQNLPNMNPPIAGTL